ncbi:hypothetical protein P9D36_16565 [Bacillus haynesii]|uniref:hypothetical protein n=1 Tax=Bacillus haynesii TaxID=1925021 RepID=UPI001592F85F|nr:hypothetical protein [Bacillus haynesii]NVB32946.1 hypothetical protein [Bacillus licheniformis]MCY7779879.1 hypothetical protein [Bacillus haynesii]MCY8224251.1 hypothetical protein [Bacillus haynesii]MCY8371527.1 hypothetical protein [Bacillus haynesii]MCY8671181.1 hypothetical protein [Bacillus haynesii]
MEFVTSVSNSEECLGVSTSVTIPENSQMGEAKTKAVAEGAVSRGGSRPSRKTSGSFL